MNDHLDRAMDAVLHDLDAAHGPRPRVEAADWQDWPTAESAFLWAADGSGHGVWVDTATPPAEQLVQLADQVQEWAVEEMSRVGWPTNWPSCPEHPVNHPLEPVVDDGVAMWRCPTSARPVCEIGHLGGMSIMAVDERDNRWEQLGPRFRVYIQDGVTQYDRERTGGTTGTYDVVGADVLQVIDWAQRQATGGATYSIALVSDRDGERGLVWLVGMDGNDTSVPGDPESVLQARMLARRSAPVGIAAADRSPR